MNKKEFIAQKFIAAHTGFIAEFWVDDLETVYTDMVDGLYGITLDMHNGDVQLEIGGFARADGNPSIFVFTPQ